MADAEEGGAGLAAGVLDEFHGAEGVVGVEAGGGLVGEDEVGLAGDGAGDGDALLLADGEFLRRGVGAVDAEVA